ncbi:MAG: hypothetical protein NZ898_00250 [Myxococcota bacterium]|nr:hypothetical protein [Myxococcota bacterium]
MQRRMLARHGAIGDPDRALSDAAASPPRPSAAGRSGSGRRATVLVAGEGEPMLEAIVQALDRHRVSVSTAPSARLVDAIVATSPQLVVLVGKAAASGGREAVARVTSDPRTASVPVVVVVESGALEHRLEALRAGAVAVVPRSPSADSIARAVIGCLESATPAGFVGEATLDELVELVRHRLRSGIVSVQGPTGGPVRLVLGAGRPVAEAVEQFVARLRSLVTKAEPLRVELVDASAMLTLDVDEGPASLAMGALNGTRVLVVEDDPARADALAQELRSAGALVAVVDTAGRGLDRAREIDPAVAVVAASAAETAAFELVRTLRRDPQLRWTALLLVGDDDLWPEPRRGPTLERVVGRLVQLLEPDRTLASRVATEPSVDVRLETTGPSRLLRALATAPGAVHASVREANRCVDLDLAGGLLVGARVSGETGAPREGLDALVELLAMTTGRALIERRTHPALANVMMPLDEALAHSREVLLEKRIDVPSAPPPLPASRPQPPSSLGAAHREAWPTPAVPIEPEALLRAANGATDRSEARGPLDSKGERGAPPSGSSTGAAIDGELRTTGQLHESVVDIPVESASVGSSADVERKLSPEIVREDPRRLGELGMVAAHGSDASEVVVEAVFQRPVGDPREVDSTAQRRKGRWVVPAAVAAAGVLLVAVIWLALEARKSHGGSRPERSTPQGAVSERATSPTSTPSEQPRAQDGVRTAQARAVEPDAVEAESGRGSQPRGTSDTTAPSADAVEPEVESGSRPSHASSARTTPATEADVGSQMGGGAPSMDREGSATPRADADSPTKRTDRLSVSAALEALERGDPATAEAIVAALLEANSRDNHAMEAMARRRPAPGRPADAVLGADRAGARRPGRARYPGRVGVARRAAGDETGARAAWRAALALDPDDRAARARLATSAP